MIPARTRYARCAILLLGLALAGPSRADWRTALPVTVPVPFQDETFYRLYTFRQQAASIDAEGFHLLGPRLLRYSHDGTPGAVGTDALAGTRVDQYDRLSRTPDGRLYGWSQSYGIVAFDPAGASRWSAPLRASLSSPPLIDPDGSVRWLEPVYGSFPDTTLHLRRRLPDGEAEPGRALRLAEALQVPSLASPYDLQLRRLPGSTDLLVAANENHRRGVVARISAQGEVRWAATVEGRLLRLGETSTLVALADGGILVAAVTDELRWNVAQLGADGTLRASGSFAQQPGMAGTRVALSAQGGIFQYDVALDGRAVVTGRDVGGRELWRRDRVDGCRSLCAVVATANGDLFVSGFASDGFVFHRYAADGTLRFERHAREFEPALLIGTLLGERPDGSMLLALRRRSENAAKAAPPRVWDEWVAYAPDGTLRARATLPPLAGSEGARPAVGRDADGRSYVVAASADATRDHLHVVDPAGRLTGSTALEPRDDYGVALHGAPCGAELCVVHAYGVKAYRDRGLGGIAWRSPSAEAVAAAYFYRDGAILLQHYRADPRVSDVYDPYLTLLDAQGRPVGLPDVRRAVAAFDPVQGALVSDPGGATLRLRADGTLEPAAALPRGGSLETAPPGHVRGALRHSLLPDGDLAVTVEFHRAEDFTGLRRVSTRRLARLAPDGRLRWQRDFVEGGATFELALQDVALSWSADGADLLLAGRRPSTGAIRLLALRGDSGEVLTQREVACPAAACDPVDFAPGAGRAVFGVARAARGAPAEHVLLRLDGLFDDARLPAGAALAGLWYTPEATGQGLAVQVADDGTLGAAWFTHARSAALSPATLRWYTLAGRTEAPAPEVSLTLFAAPGGSFAAPPAVAAVPVGQARLWLGDCGRLELRLRFDESHVVGGDDTRAGGEVALTLQRLIEPTAACTPAGAGAPLAARVSDARVGGVWYSPATSGQGLFLYRLEATATQPALVAGAWFTHDPAGSGGAAAESAHWFTLSADGAAGETRVPLAIGQTIGGHLGAGATRNATRVGAAEARPLDCQRLDFSYRFEEREEARAFRGRQGTLALERLFGSCTP